MPWAQQEENLKYLRRFAEEEIKRELEAALGVAAVKVSGGLEDEIQILLDQGRLAQLNLPIEQLARQIGSENVNLSGGRLEEGTQQYLVRTLNQFKSIEEIGEVIISTADNKNAYCAWFCPFGAAQECMAAIGGATLSVPHRHRRRLAWIHRGLAWLALMLAFLFRNPGLSSYEVFGAAFAFTGSSVKDPQARNLPASFSTVSVQVQE